MIKLKVTNVGNALGVALPKAALDRLHVMKGDTLILSVGVDGMHLLSPDNVDITREIEIAERGIDRYRKALRALAKK
jgi:putative addiction module antidote